MENLPIKMPIGLSNNLLGCGGIKEGLVLLQKSCHNLFGPLLDKLIMHILYILRLEL